jgi:Putative Ig domain
VAVVLGLALAGCGQTTRTIAPSGLTYSSNPATYTVGVAITPNNPSSSGGAVASYSVSPALPAGLSLNTSTGVITGIPTTATSSAVTCTVTATNAVGSTTVSLAITVNPPTPVALVWDTGDWDQSDWQ